MSPLALALSMAAVVLTAGPVQAQQQTEPERCPRFVAYDFAPLPVIRAAFAVPAAQTKPGLVQLTYVGHATFLIESPAGVTIVTDYNGNVRPNVIPRIATMNRAHVTHYTLSPERGIEHVLHGWRDDGQPARHEVTVEDVWLRNVTTNIRNSFGGGKDQNSIFVFEVAGLCIAHLGHLHHTLTKDHLKGLGRIDVVLAPVDGSYTLSIDDMIEVLQSIGAPLVIPMHFFTRWSLDAFLARLNGRYVIERSDTPRVTLSRDTLPRRPTVLALPGY